MSCEGVPLYHINPLLDKQVAQKWPETKTVQKMLEQTSPKMAKIKTFQKVQDTKLLPKVPEQTSPKMIMT